MGIDLRKTSKTTLLYRHVLKDQITRRYLASPWRVSYREEGVPDAVGAGKLLFAVDAALEGAKGGGQVGTDAASKSETALEGGGVKAGIKQEESEKAAAPAPKDADEATAADAGKEDGASTTLPPTKTLSQKSMFENVVNPW